MPRNLTFGPKQKQIIFSKSPRQFVSGSYRSAKSTTILYKIIQICRFEPNSKFLIGRYFHADLLGDTYAILFDEADGLLNKKLGIWNKQLKTFRFYNGSLIYFRRLDISQGLKGMTLSGYYIEQAEQIKEKVWKDIQSRLSHWGNKDTKTSNYNKYIEANKGRTDVRAFPQTYEFLGCNPDATSFLKKKFIGKNVKGWEQWHLTMWDNEINLGKEYIEKQIEENNEIWVKRYVFGSWEAADGIIYTEFNDGHLKDHKPISTLETLYGKLKFIAVLDPGYTHQFGVLFSVITTNGRIICIDEIYETGKTAQEIAEIIKLKIVTFGRKPDLFIMDYAANKKDGTSGKSYYDIFLENGINCQNAKKNVMEGINEVKNKLKNNTLNISRHCRNIIEELQMYTWDKNTPDTPLKANDHLLDCLRYTVMHFIKVKEDPKEVVLDSKEFHKGFNKSLVVDFNKQNKQHDNLLWTLYED